MVISKTYSHMNGEEYFIHHLSALYKELKQIIANISVKKQINQNTGTLNYHPEDIKNTLQNELNRYNWLPKNYEYYITLDRNLMDFIKDLDPVEQKHYLETHNESVLCSNSIQIGFYKDNISVEVQFSPYAAVAYDLFVKHMLFYSGGVINLGIEILPTKRMQQQMSSGIAYYEGEVYNVMRQGRNNPPVPLLILGIEPE